MRIQVVLRLAAALLVLAALSALLWIFVAGNAEVTGPIGIALAVVGIALSALTWWRAEMLRRSDLSDAVEAEYGVAIESLPGRLSTEVLRSTRPSALLLPERRIMPFRGRRNELEAIRAWCNDPSASRFCILEGPAGTGKTRLWVELVEAGLEAGWRAGRVRPGHEREAYAALVRTPGAHIVVVEASEAGEELADLLADLASDADSRRWRVLLVCRSRLSIPRVRGVSAQAVLDAAMTTPGGPLRVIGGNEDRARWYREAANAFAAALGSIPPERLRSNNDTEDPIGVVVASGLAATLGVRQHSEDVFVELADIELGHWTVPSGDGDPREPGRCLTRRAFALAWLVGARSAKEICDAGRPALSVTGVDIEIAATHLARLYPGPAGDLELPPEAITVPIAIPELLHDSNFAWIVDVFAAQPILTKATIVGRLISQVPNYPTIRELINELLQNTSLPLDGAGLAVIGRFVDRSESHDRLLAAMIATQSIGLSAEFEELTHQLQDAGMVRAAAAAANAWVSFWQGNVNEVDDQHRRSLALALGTYATCLRAVGGESLAASDAAKKSLALYQQLADQDHALYDSDLAGSLNNYAVSLADIGDRTQEALDIAHEAVDVYRRLAIQDPVLHVPHLAGTLSNYSNRLAAIGGRGEEAIEAAKESVDLYRQLVNERGSAYKSDFAGSLGTYSTRLADMGKLPEEALAAAGESVEIYRLLDEDTPALYKAKLAGALNRYSNRLADIGGNRQEAINSAKESVDLWRQLAGENHALHDASLAQSLNSYANRLAKIGSLPREALHAAEESIALYRQLSTENPALHEPELALALHNYSNRLSAIGDRSSDAIDAAKESLDLYQRLASHNPALFSVHVAQSLGTYANRLADSGQTVEAIEAATEGADLYRRLGDDRNSRDVVRLAIALKNLAVHLVNAGAIEPALERATEALAIAKGLPSGAPIASEDLTAFQRMVVDLLEMLGRTDEAQLVRVEVGWPAAAGEDQGSGRSQRL